MLIFRKYNSVICYTLCFYVPVYTFSSRVRALPSEVDSLLKKTRVNVKSSLFL